MMTTRRLVMIAAATLALAGCSSTTPSAGSGAAPPDTGPSPSASVDAGTMDATASYLTALGEVDKKLVTDTRAALDNGMETCVDIDERRPDAEQEKNVATRFAVTPAEAKKVLAVAKDNLCLE
jgi:type IV pilus biogenesis protein CpaD/CtpE